MTNLRTSTNLPPRLAGKFARKNTAEKATAELAQGDNYADVELFSEKRLAQLLETSKGALQHWRHKGVGPRYLKLGRMVRYSRKDVAAWIASLSTSSEKQLEDECR